MRAQKSAKHLVKHLSSTTHALALLRSFYDFPRPLTMCISSRPNVAVLCSVLTLVLNVHTIKSELLFASQKSIPPFFSKELFDLSVLFALVFAFLLEQMSTVTEKWVGMHDARGTE